MDGSKTKRKTERRRSVSAKLGIGRVKADPIDLHRRKKPKLTRDWLLLVKDQDIFDFTNSTPIDRMKEFAGRFAAIAQIIRGAASPVARQGLEGAGPGPSSEPASHSGILRDRAAAAAAAGAVETETVDQKVRKIERIERESRVKGFRVIVSAIKQGLATGRDWYAHQTALAVVAELFHHTGDYFRAFDEFCASVLAKRKL